MYDFKSMTNEEIKVIVEDLSKKLNFDFLEDGFKISKKGNLMLSNNQFVFDGNLKQVGGNDIFTQRKIIFIEDNKAQIIKSLENICKIQNLNMNANSKSIRLFVDLGNTSISENRNYEGFDCSDIEKIVSALIPITNNLKIKVKQEKELYNTFTFETKKRCFDAKITRKITELFKKDFEEGKIKNEFVVGKNFYLIYKGMRFVHENSYCPSENIKYIIEYDDDGLIKEVTPEKDLSEYASKCKEELTKKFITTSFSYKKEINLEKIKNFLDEDFYLTCVNDDFLTCFDIDTKKFRTVEGSILPNKNITSLKNHYFKYDIETEKIEIIDKNILSLQKNFKKYKDFKDKCLEILNEEEIKLFPKKGDGILFSETSCLVKYEDIDFVRNINPVGLSKNGLKEFKKIVSEIKNECKVEIDFKYKAKKIKFAKFNNDFIYYDIFKFIKENENYITENAVVQALRGNKVQLDTEIVKTENFGKYNYFAKEDISYFIHELLNNNLLTKRRIDGKYGVFYILKIKDEDGIVVLKPDLSPKNYKISEINKKVKEGKTLTDCECYIYFNHNKDKKELKNYINSLSCLSKGFMSLYEEDYLNYIKDAPENFQKLIKLKKKTEEDDFLKKCYTKIEKSFK